MDPDERLDGWRRGAFAAGIISILIGAVSDWSLFLLVGLGLFAAASMSGRRRSHRLFAPLVLPPDRCERTGIPHTASPKANDFEVVMLSPGTRLGEVKYALISLLRATEPEAATLLITRPAVIKRGISGRDADRLKTALERLGATVDVVRMPSASVSVQAIPRSEPAVSRRAPSEAQPPARRGPVIVPMPALFDLVLVDGGTKKIDARKALKQHLGLDLLEAYNAVEHTPSVLKRATTRSEADRLKTAIEASGARLEVRPASE